MRISQAPTTITDIPATILDGVGVAQDLPGEPALKLSEDAPRVRPWAFYDWEHDDWGQNYFETLDILEINGPVLDGNNWTLLEHHLRARQRARPCGRAACTRLQRSRSGVEYRWSMPDIFLHVPAGTRSFEMKIRSIAPKPQTVTVSAGDHVLGKVTLDDQSWVTMKYALPPPQTPAAHWVHVNVDPPWRAPGSKRACSACRRATSCSPPEPCYTADVTSGFFLMVRQGSWTLRTDA